MRHTKLEKLFTLLTCFGCTISAAKPSSATAQHDLADLIDTLWTATDSTSRSAAAARIVNGEFSFNAVYQALAQGPVYRPDVPTGRVEREHEIDGMRHPYFFVVPDDYDPGRRYPVRFFLHGGVRRPEWDSGGRWWRQWRDVSARDFITIFPASWAQSPWWSGRQIENLATILTALKREYNIDENRVSMFGVSDGGSAVYLYAFRDATRWSAFLPLIGHPAVLNNPRISLDELYLTNLIARPFLIVNAQEDRLYPAASMRVFLEAFRYVGVDFEFRPQPGGHDVSWWSDEWPNMNRFLADHPRDPLPARLSWETERTDRYNRFHWIRIDRVDSTAAILAPRYDPFPHEHPAGRLDVVREGNNISVTSRDVLTFTLLLSPEVFDFSTPVTITASGVLLHNGLVKPDVETLVEWVSRDLDRTMLFGAEITLEVPNATSHR